MLKWFYLGGITIAPGIIYLFFYLGMRSYRFRYYIRNHIWLHPNWICVWRTNIAFIGMLFYFLSSNFYLTLGGISLFVVAIILDGVDGLVARHCRLETEFGQWLDPFCDKLIYLIPLLIFAYKGYLWVKLVWLLVIVEIVGQFIVRKILQRSNLPVGANYIGKIKAVVCFGLVVYCGLLDLLGSKNFNQINYVLWIAIILASGSAVFKLKPFSFWRQDFSYYYKKIIP